MEIPPRVDEERSVAMSQSSQFSTMQALSVARFKPMEQMLFFYAYPLSRHLQLPPTAGFVFLAFMLMQWIGLTSKFHNWPVSGKFGELFFGVFHYLDFTISWSKNSVLLVFQIVFLCIVIMFTVFSTLCGLMARFEKPLPKKQVRPTAVLGRVLFTMFALPAINVSTGSMQCLTNMGHLPFELTCSSSKPFFIAAGIAIFFLMITAGFVYHMFVYEQNMVSKDPFAAQTNILPTLLYVVVGILAFISPLFSNNVLIFGILCAITFLFFCLLFCFYQPFYSIMGQALYSSTLAIAFVSSLITILSCFINPPDKPLSVGFSIMFMLLMLLLACGVAFGAFILTKKIAQSRFAVRPGEAIPYLPQSKSFSSKSQTTLFSLSSGTPRQVQVQEFTPSNSPSVRSRPVAVLDLSESSAYNESIYVTENQISSASGPQTTVPLSALSTNMSTQECVSECAGDFLLSEQKPIAKTHSNHVVVIEEKTVKTNEISPRCLDEEMEEGNITPDPEPMPENMPTIKLQPPVEVSTPTFIASSRLPIITQPIPPAQPTSTRHPLAEPSTTLPRLLSEQINPPRTLPKFKSVKEIQRAIRFVVDPEMLKSEAHLSLVERILDWGIRRFPQSSSLWTTNALFNQNVRNNTLRTADAFQHAKQSVPHIIERWTQFAFIRDVEAKETSEGEQSASALFRSRMDRGQRQHEAAKAYLRQVYTQLSKSSFDVQRVHAMLISAIEALRSSRKHYSRLLQQYPSNPQVLRGYGSLIRDIERDDDTARMLLNKATQFEENTDQLETMDLSQEGDMMSRVDGRDQQRAPQKRQRRNKKKKKNSQHVMDGFSFPDDTPPVTTVLTVLTIALPIVIVIVQSIAYLFTSNFFRLTIAQTEVVFKMSNLQLNMARMLHHVELWKIVHSDAVVTNPSLLTECKYLLAVEEMDEKVSESAEEIEEGLYDSYNTIPEESRSLFEVVNNTIYFAQVNNADEMSNIWGTQMNMLDFALNIQNSLNHIREYGNPKERLTQKEIYWLFLNAPVIGMEMIKGTCVNLSDQVHTLASSTGLTNIVFAIIVIAITIYPTMYCFVRKSFDFRKNRRKAFFKFVTAPKKRILELKKRLDDLEKDDDSTVEMTVNTKSGDEEENISDASLSETDEVMELSVLSTKPPTPNKRLSNQPQLLRSPSELLRELNLPSASPINSVYQTPVLTYSNGEPPTLPFEPEPNEKRSSLLRSMQNTQSMPHLQQHHGHVLNPQLSSMSELPRYMPHPPNATRNTSSLAQSIPVMSSFPLQDRNPSPIQQNVVEPTQAQPEPEKEEEGTNAKTDKEEQEMEELQFKIDKMPGVLPRSVCFALVFFLVVSWGSLAGFFLTSITTVYQSDAQRNAVFLSNYRSSLLDLMTFLALQIVFEPTADPPKEFSLNSSTRPGWNDFSHLKIDDEEHQKNIATLLSYLLTIHRKVKEGSADHASYLTGDEMIDRLDTVRTLEKGTQLYAITMDARECFWKAGIRGSPEPDECQDGRMVGIADSFMGLEGLMTAFASAAGNVVSMKDPRTNLLPQDQSIQSILTIQEYDLFNGLEWFTSVMLEELTTELTTLDQTVMLVSLSTIVTLFLCSLICLRQAGKRISNVEHNTLLIQKMDPANDNTLQGLEWSDQYMCEIELLDEGHASICKAAVSLMRKMGEDGWEKARRAELKKFYVVLLSVLEEEEVLMQRHSVGRVLIRSHQRQHVHILKKVNKSIWQLYQNTPQSQHFFVSTISAWLTEHVAKSDRDLGARLEEKMTESEKEECVNKTDFVIPRSFRQFLQSDHCSMKDKKSFEKLLQLLRLHASDL